MRAEERAIMMSHIAYWTEIMNQGKVLAFRRVLDPAELYTPGIICVNNEQAVKEFFKRSCSPN